MLIKRAKITLCRQCRSPVPIATVSNVSQAGKTYFKVNCLLLPLVIFFIMSVSAIRPAPGRFLPRRQVNWTLDGDDAAA